MYPKYLLLELYDTFVTEILRKPSKYIVEIILTNCVFAYISCLEIRFTEIQKLSKV